MAKKSFPNKSVKSKKNSVLESCFRLLSIRSRSEQEIRQKLERKFAQLEIDKAIERLKQLDLVNDAEFAKQYIASRNRTRPRSWRMLQLELRRKGVMVKSREDFQPLDDLSLAASALEKKKNLKTRDQAIRFLTSRGFSWEIVEKAIRGRYNANHVS